jgi:hypothetical protein
MEIKCTHCSGNWSVKNIDSPSAIMLFKQCRPSLTADTIRSLRNVLGVGMMESKIIATHVTKVAGKCFNCGNKLLFNKNLVKTCVVCGALNLDIHNV